MTVANVAIAVVAILAGFTSNVSAQEYPSRPIRVLVGSSPGSATDVFARTAAQYLGTRLKQSIIVDNRAGAGGSIAVELAKRAQPDGYTLLWINQGEFAVLPNLRQVPYDPIKDFIPLAMLVEIPSAYVVHSAVPATTMQELVQLAKAKPKSIRWGSSGYGSGAFFQGEMLRYFAGIDVVHVPFKGGADALAALMGQQIELGVQGFGSISKQVAAGQLRVLATTGKSRFSGMPNVPTMIESGFGDFVTTSWWGMVSPQGVAAPIVERLSRELVTVGQSEPFRKRIADYAAESDPLPGEAFGEFISQEFNRARLLVQKAGIKMDN
jgi:tripartite-type tricarboxylate transporter receptor subunit TctC